MQQKPAVLHLIENGKEQYSDYFPFKSGIGDYHHLKGFNTVHRKTYTNWKEVLPIIVIEDLIKEGDKAMHKGCIKTIKLIQEGGALFFEEGSVGHSWDCKKIIVLPEQIPNNVIDAVVAGKLVDGSLVLVEMKRYLGPHEKESDYPSGKIDINLKGDKAIVSWQEQPKVKNLADISTSEVSGTMAKIRQRVSDRKQWLSKNPGKSVDDYMQMKIDSHYKEQSTSGVKRFKSLDINWIDPILIASNAYPKSNGPFLEGYVIPVHLENLRNIVRNSVKWARENPEVEKEIDWTELTTKELMAISEKSLYNEADLIESDIEKDAENFSNRFKNTVGLFIPTEDVPYECYIKGRQDERNLSGKGFKENDIKSVIKTFYSVYCQEEINKGKIPLKIQYWLE